MESFEGEVEPDSYWKKKEAFLRGSTVSLGEKFSSGTCNPASPLSISCLVAFFLFLVVLFFNREDQLSHEPVRARYLLYAEAFSELYIYAY